MLNSIIVADSYFDGTKYYNSSKYSILILDGKIIDVLAGDKTLERHLLPDEFKNTQNVQRTKFLMPGLAEGHCHLFLKGSELDFKKRSLYLKESTKEDMLNIGRENLQKHFNSGVTLLRDAGDSYGINLGLKEEIKKNSEIYPKIITAGLALRKEKRYGSFMATQVTDEQSIRNTIKYLSLNADQLKVLMTGIIDFENGLVKGKPQFTLDEAKIIVEVAKSLNKSTFAHCSGLDGLEICVDSGMDSIEHGFFMNQEILEKMLEKDISWVPTYTPVGFQKERPELAGWNAATVDKLEGILANHRRHIKLAFEMGVNIIAGSDAGSYGVEHGKALINELIVMKNCGVSTEKVLASATSIPRKIWGLQSNSIVKGNVADMLLLDASAFDSIENMRKINTIITQNSYYRKSLLCA